ncbi:MAG: nucleotide-binding protein [Acidobacteria bacterium]|nr:nucleotide-binding protein [Acidobacteriota bacterium]
MRVPVSLLALVFLAGCGKQQPALDVKSAAPASAPAASASAPASGVVPAAPEPALVTVSGTVLETMDAAEYTYMRLKTATGETWAAINRTKIAKGDAVTVTNAMVMDGFQSKTLNRTFDHILFGVLAKPGAPAPAAAGVPAAPMASGHQPAAGAAAPPTQEQMAAQHGQAAGGPADAPDVKVPKAEGSNAKTVAELWAQRASLKGKEVAVKAKIVKVTNSVMGKNWLHVRDGSGSKATKDNDLTVTTDVVARTGDVVTVTGTVSVDKDFGAGYAYPVIIENAKVK